MAPQAQALLSSLIAKAVCGGRDDVHDDANENEDELLDIGGVEILVNEGCSGSHVAHLRFDDKPKVHGLCASIVYYSFEASLGGLLGEKLADDPINQFDGSEIIASDATHGNSDCTLNPVGDSESWEGSFAPRLVYPMFMESPGEWLGGKGDATIENVLVETDANGGADIGYARRCFPHSGTRRGGDACLDNIFGESFTESARAVAEVGGNNLGCGVLGESSSKVSASGVDQGEKCTAKPTRAQHSKGFASTSPRPPEAQAFYLHEDEQTMLLISAFLALPREDLLRAMSAATMSRFLKCGTPLLPCTGCLNCDRTPLLAVA